MGLCSLSPLVLLLKQLNVFLIQRLAHIYIVQVALPSYLFVETFTATLPIALGFAAGSMVWVVFAELMPDALEDLNHGSVATAATLSAGWCERKSS